MKPVPIITYLAIVLLLWGCVLLYVDGITFGGVSLVLGQGLLLVFLILQRRGSI